MLTTSNVPESARATLRIIDGALESLAKDGAACFIEHEKKLRVRHKTKHLGFERQVIDELFLCLEDELGVTVSDEVAVPGRRLIDLKLSFANCPAFIELGMYFGGFRAKYGTDCKKLREIIDRQRAAIGVLIHFHFYEDWDDRVDNYFRQELPDTELGEGYWSHFRVVPDDAPLKQKHFARLAFGRNAAICSPLTRKIHEELAGADQAVEIV